MFQVYHPKATALGVNEVKPKLKNDVQCLTLQVAPTASIVLNATTVLTATTATDAKAAQIASTASPATTVSSV
jgi:hypothetical protein